MTARQAGRAIVEEAVQRRSEVIMVGTTRKRRIGNMTFGKTTDYVLDHAPCEVLLNLVPRDYPTEGSSVVSELGHRAAAASCNGRQSRGPKREGIRRVPCMS